MEILTEPPSVLSDRWAALLPKLRAHYASAEPFPHVVLDDFLIPAVANQALAEFPLPDSGQWAHYTHVNEKKLGKKDLESFGPTLRGIIEELNSQRFIDFLTEVAGIQGLLPDESLEGGGLHQSEPGGFLNIHADFTVHPHHANWRRRVNVLVYLNQHWQDAYGGHLELWDRQMKACVKKIAPVFNRCVIFNTDQDSFHGHPTPLACPQGITRKSIALYYFTEESNPLLVRSTEYRARPGEGFWKRTGIFVDKMALRMYDRIKRQTGISDRLTNALMRFFSPKKGG